MIWAFFAGLLSQIYVSASEGHAVLEGLKGQVLGSGGCRGPRLVKDLWKQVSGAGVLCGEGETLTFTDAIGEHGRDLSAGACEESRESVDDQ